MPQYGFKSLIIIFFQVFIVSYQPVGSADPYYTIGFRMKFTKSTFCNWQKSCFIKPVFSIWLGNGQNRFFTEAYPNPAGIIFYHIKFTGSAAICKMTKRSIRNKAFLFFIKLVKRRITYKPGFSFYKINGAQGVF